MGRFKLHIGGCRDAIGTLVISKYEIVGGGGALVGVRSRCDHGTSSYRGTCPHPLRRPGGRLRIVAAAGNLSVSRRDHWLPTDLEDGNGPEHSRASHHRERKLTVGSRDAVPVGFGQVRKPTQLPVLTMVTGYSRWLSAVLIPTRSAADLFAGWWQLIARLGAVPRVLVWDGEGAIGRWRGGQVELTAECQAFRGTLGAKVIVLQTAPTGGQRHHRARARLPGALVPARPQLHRPGRLQHPTAAVARRWSTRGRRRALGCAPTDRIAADRKRDAHPVAGRTGDRVAVLVAAAARSLRPLRLQRLLGAPGVIGRRIEVIVDLHRVRAVCDG